MAEAGILKLAIEKRRTGECSRSKVYQREKVRCWTIFAYKRGKKDVNHIAVAEERHVAGNARILRENDCDGGDEAERGAEGDLLSMCTSHFAQSPADAWFSTP
jgi:hypothetical protein